MTFYSHKTVRALNCYTVFISFFHCAPSPTDHTVCSNQNNFDIDILAILFSMFWVSRTRELHCCTLSLSSKSNQIKSIHLFSKHIPRLYSITQLGFFITAIDSHIQSRVLVVRAPRLSCLYDLWMVHWWVIGGCKDGQPERY
jgi:hypothetical protein